MSTTLLQVLDIGFLIFHTLVILMNSFGWIWKPLRRWHLALLAITAFSWFVLGRLLGYGWGYCFCTDWHYRVRAALGIDDGGISYIQLLFRMVGTEISTAASNWLAYGVFGGSILAAAVVNGRDWAAGRLEKRQKRLEVRG
jgi:hypothetical protein